MKQPELASFVPSLVARRLLERPDPPSTPEVERFDAAALFADISGFTGLAERLAQTGPSGVEALSELLNGCFGELVQLVATHGGDVVKFAGDALLALWRADSGWPRHGHRQRHGQFAVQVRGRAFAFDPVKQLLGERLDAWPELLHPLGREVRCQPGSGGRRPRAHHAGASR